MLGLNIKKVNASRLMVQASLNIFFFTLKVLIDVLDLAAAQQPIRTILKHYHLLTMILKTCKQVVYYHIHISHLVCLLFGAGLVVHIWFIRAFFCENTCLPSKYYNIWDTGLGFRQSCVPV